MLSGTKYDAVTSAKTNKQSTIKGTFSINTDRFFYFDLEMETVRRRVKLKEGSSPLKVGKLSDNPPSSP